MNATHILVYTKNFFGEMAESRSVAIIDKGVPVNKPLSVSFKDQDLSLGKLMGSVVIKRAEIETDLTHYVLYWGSSPAQKASSAPIVSLPKKGFDVIHDFPIGTVKPANASYLIAFTKNSDGELFSGVSSLIDDRRPPEFYQEAYIKAVNADADDNFGCYVSLSGDTLAVAACGEDSNQTTITNGTGASTNNFTSNSGAVYVYRRSGVNWEQEAYIKAVNANVDDGSGTLSLSGDTLAVGAPDESSNQTTITNGPTASADNSVSSAGAVYVYRRSGVSWAQEAYIKAENAKVQDNFGSNVSLSGNTLAVGAFFEDSSQSVIIYDPTRDFSHSIEHSGAVYVYRRSGGNWSQEAFIKAANAGKRDRFGGSASLSGDTLAVGAYGEDSNQTTITNGSTASSDNSLSDSGAVYVYRRGNRMFDPHVRIGGATETSVTLAWENNLGNAAQVKIAPVVSGTTSAAENCDGGVVLSAGTTSYTYSGLSSGNKYGFRVCATDGTSTTAGVPIWADTE